MILYKKEQLGGKLKKNSTTIPGIPSLEDRMKPTPEEALQPDIGELQGSSNFGTEPESARKYDPVGDVNISNIGDSIFKTSEDKQSQLASILPAVSQGTNAVDSLLKGSDGKGKGIMDLLGSLF